jgi:Holliday junction DNA helicase RuvA
MIALLHGQIAYKSIDHLILDVGGVGYRLFIPLSTFYALPAEGAIQLHVHTHVREDALLLYGFLTPSEKEMFSKLLAVGGVGPKLALNILSHISVDQLRDALVQKDIKRLSSLPGIGKKTAERLILELSDKIPRLAPTLSGASPAGRLVILRDDPLEDALSALINLGYKENHARKVLDMLEVSPGNTVEDILKGALRVLVR